MQFSILITLALSALAVASPSQRAQKRCAGSDEDLAAAEAEAQAALDAGQDNPLVNNGLFTCSARGDGESFTCSDFSGATC